MALATFFLIENLEWARSLFANTEIIILINAVWFSLGIVGYGIYGLVKNWKRARLSHLNIKLDTQFLIVVAFFFFGINQVIDLLVFLEVNTSEIFLTAMRNTGKVLEFGGFMAGLTSIY